MRRAPNRDGASGVAENYGHTSASRKASASCTRELTKTTPSIGQHAPESLRDFKDRLDSTIKQLASLATLLSGSVMAIADAPTGTRGHQQVSYNESNREDEQEPIFEENPLSKPSSVQGCPCYHQNSMTHDTGSAKFLQDDAATESRTLNPISPKPSSKVKAANRRKRQHQSQCEQMSTGYSADTATFVASQQGRMTDKAHYHNQSQQQQQQQQHGQKVQSYRSSVNGSSAVAVSQQQKQQQQQQQQQKLNSVCSSVSGCGAPVSQSADSISLLWFDPARRRYSSRQAELICAKSVRRLHLSVHFFRVCGEDLLLLEKDCSVDGLAFLDVDSTVAFEGLSVEKVLCLQRLGCQLQPDDLSREFAVEKGSNKYYLVPVESDANGDFRLCSTSEAQPRLESFRRMLEQQESRRFGDGVASGTARLKDDAKSKIYSRKAAK